jgi:multidrug efflux pump subunit AcrA (membrane-fusion protein)
VFERDGRHFCYVATRRGLVPREVVLGPSNRDFVVIEKGLQRGDRVALRDPSAAPSDFGSLSSS